MFPEDCISAAPPTPRSREQWELGQATQAAPRQRPRRVPLRWYIVGVVAVAILPGLVASVIEMTQDIGFVRADTQRRLQAAAARVGGGLAREMNGLSLALSGLAASGDLDHPSLDQRGRLASFQARAAELARDLGAPIVLRGPDGVPVLDTAQPFGPVPGDQPDAALVRRAMATRRAGVADAATHPGQGETRALVYAPVIRDGEVSAVLQTRLTATRVRAVIDQEHIDPEMRVALFDGSGAVIARFPDAGAGAPPPPATAPPPGPPSAAAMSEGLAADGTKVLYVTAPVPAAPGWHVRVSIPHDAYLVRWAGPLPRRIGGHLAEAGLGAFFAVWLGRRLVRVLGALGERAQAVAAGAGATVAVPPSNIRELEDLRSSLLRAEALLHRREVAESMALQEARTGTELLSSVVNGTADHILVKNLEGRYLLVNRSALAAVDPAQNESTVLGRRPTEVVGPALGAISERTDREVLRTGSVVEYMIDWAPVGSGIRTYSVRKSPWRDAAGRILGIVSVNRDVTGQKAAEARLRAAQAELLRATRLSSMGAMASGLAHELNQPLSAATNYLNAVQHMMAKACVPGDCKAVAQRTGAALGDACAQVKRAAEIVRRLSEFVRRGEAEVTCEDVGDLLHEVEQLAGAGGILSGTELVVPPVPAGLEVLADRIQVQQVLLNLVRNAAEALAGAPPGTRGRIRMTAAPHPQGGAEIIVADNGPGLSAAVRQHLFEPFVSSKPDGMGIGLSICRTIIEGHGGRITADQGPDGTTFRIVLPSPCQSGVKS